MIETAQAARLIIFLCLLATFLCWEKLDPRRPARYSKKTRWMINGSITLVNSLLLRLTLPVAAITAAIYAEQESIGLFNNLTLSEPLVFCFSLLLLDFFIYLQHYLFHRIDFFWRMHRLHHTDGDLDVTSALRFHPFEIVLSLLFKTCLVIVFGIPVFAVLAFEIILNAMAMFNHSNINIPLPIDKVVRKLFVTPDMHRIHHSQTDIEMNSNYGFNLSIWDKIFSTYIENPALSQRIMSLGLHSVRFDKQRDILYLLRLPFLPAKLESKSNNGEPHE